MSSPIAASGVWFDMSVPIPPLGLDDITVVTAPKSPAVPAKKGKNSSTKKPVSPKVQEAIMTAKVNADVGNNIRWDIIMHEIADLAPAPPRHITPILKSVELPLKSFQSTEDSTSAGETDSERSVGSECSSPTAGFRPPPGLSGPPGLLPPPGLKCLPGLAGPPGLSAPPGLDDCPPPPGFEAFPALTSSAPSKAAKATTQPPWRKSKMSKQA